MCEAPFSPANNLDEPEQSAEFQLAVHHLRRALKHCSTLPPHAVLSALLVEAMPLVSQCYGPVAGADLLTGLARELHVLHA